MNFTMDSLSQLLRRRRRELGVTQADLARLAGLSLHGVSDLETGRGNPTLETLVKLTDALGLRIVIEPELPEALSGPENLEARR
jgi:transcriptional regulator with XRE-family HTH domain